MSSSQHTSLTVVPAYRVVAHFVRQARHLPQEEALDYLERHVRQYVRSSLSGLHGSYAEIGERWALSHLGDPSMACLAQALQEADQTRPREVVEETLQRCATILHRPDLAARFLLLPGDGESKNLVHQLNGVQGVSLASQATLLFFWPSGNWLAWLGYTAAHEYNHLVRNHLLPRGVAGGRAVYLKTQEPETLLDAMVSEGMADAFARQLFPNMEPRWLRALSADQEAHIWPRVMRRIKLTDPGEIRRFLHGDGDRVPHWTGYCLGYRIVHSYLARHKEARPASLVGLPGSAIFAGSQYGDRH